MDITRNNFLAAFALLWLGLATADNPDGKLTKAAVMEKIKKYTAETLETFLMDLPEDTLEDTLKHLGIIADLFSQRDPVLLELIELVDDPTTLTLLADLYRLIENTPEIKNGLENFWAHLNNEIKERMRSLFMALKTRLLTSYPKLYGRVQPFVHEIAA